MTTVQIPANGVNATATKSKTNGATQNANANLDCIQSEFNGLNAAIAEAEGRKAMLLKELDGVARSFGYTLQAIGGDYVPAARAPATTATKGKPRGRKPKAATSVAPSAVSLDVVALVKTYGPSTCEALAKASGSDKAALSVALRAAKTAGTLKVSGKARGTTYSL